MKTPFPKAGSGPADLALFNGLLTGYLLCRLSGIGGVLPGILVGFLLFLLPGLAWSRLSPEKAWGEIGVEALTRSILIWIGLAILHRVCGLRVSWLSAWLFLFAAVNAGLLLLPQPRCPVLWEKTAGNLRAGLCAALLLAALACALAWSGTRWVPPLLDNDWEAQSPAYGLIHTLKPVTITDRGFTTYLADPPLLSFQVGAAVLLFGRLEELSHYYTDALKIRRSRAEGGDAAFEKDLVERSRERYAREKPLLLETRLPGIGYSLGCAALLFLLALQISRSAAAAALFLLLFCTFPELFVQISHGGWTAPALFFMTAAAWGYTAGRPRVSFWAGFLGALMNKKMILVPASAAVSEFLLRRGDPPLRRIRAALQEPSLIGSMLGYLLFAGYGLLVDPAVYWTDFVLEHFWRRFLHLQSADGYPSLWEMWRGFDWWLGRPFLPIAALASVSLFRHCYRRRSRWILLPVWIALGAAAFSFVDWRQTRHLLRILPAATLALAFWTRLRRPAIRRLLYGVMALVIVRNLHRIAALADDFARLMPPGGW